MYLQDKLLQKNNISLKIKEIENRLTSPGTRDQDEVNDLVKCLLNFIDEKQALNLVINKANNNAELKIGHTTILLSTALVIRDTLEAKVKIITELIASAGNLDILDLQIRRDSLLEEFNSINKVIRKTDWRVSID